MFLFCFVCVFCSGGKTPDPALLKQVRTYKDVMQEQDLRRDQVHYHTKLLQYILVDVVAVSCECEMYGNRKCAA